MPVAFMHFFRLTWPEQGSHPVRVLYAVLACIGLWASALFSLPRIQTAWVGVGGYLDLPPVQPSARQSPALPLTATLTMPVVPGVNQPAQLIITLGAIQDAPQTEVTLVLPPGASVVEGESHWVVALSPGRTQTLITTIQFGQTGQQEILVHMRYPLDAYNALIGEGALGVTISETSGQVGFVPSPEPTVPPASPGNCLGVLVVGGLGLGLLKGGKYKMNSQPCGVRR